MSAATHRAPPSPLPPSGSSVIESRPRSRSFSSTPTFSMDLSKLKSANNNSTIVSSYQTAIEIASTFDVLGNHSPLCRKVKLETEGDWVDFIDKSGASTKQGTPQSADAADADDGELQINLEKFLRYCFDIAYKMPPSPSNQVLRSHVRSASHGGIPVASAGKSGGGGAAAVNVGGGSPPQLQI
mmetsp:Transcript_9403/g.20916  ORF Transcript_9403/g.20916 Transcript_9403/m.20916 type:complete len:184 (+) Transcript_9403:228-779(+)